MSIEPHSKVRPRKKWLQHEENKFFPLSFYKLYVGYIEFI